MEPNEISEKTKERFRQALNEAAKVLFPHAAKVVDKTFSCTAVDKTANIMLVIQCVIVDLDN